MPKYGLISECDQNVIEKTLKLIFDEFPLKSEVIQVTEVGIYSGETGNGIREFIRENNRMVGLTGIENGKDGERLRFGYNHLFIGDADEMAYKVNDNSQHFILIDACHCFAHTISNFFSFAPKVKPGACLAFHDTGKHIQLFKDFQHGDKNNPDAYISCRKALKKIGLIEYGVEFTWGEQYDQKYPGWELVFDEADPENEAGGICVFRKLY